MYFTAPVQEIIKRTLHSDDISGLCTIYGDCAARSECGFCNLADGDQEGSAESDPKGCDCAANPEGPGAIPMWLLCLLGGYGLFFRRSRR